MRSRMEIPEYLGMTIADIFSYSTAVLSLLLLSHPAASEQAEHCAL